jgi:hypothetical protein
MWVSTTESGRGRRLESASWKAVAGELHFGRIWQFAAPKGNPAFLNLFLQLSLLSSLPDG